MGIEWDTFFYYGNGEIENEINQDLLNGIVTKKQKLFFNRQDSAGLNDFENYPQGLAIQIGLRYNIVSWIAFRNTYTGNGTGGTEERRVATSQEQVTIETEYGNNNVSVLYIPFVNYSRAINLSIPLQGV